MDAGTRRGAERVERPYPQPPPDAVENIAFLRRSAQRARANREIRVGLELEAIADQQESDLKAEFPQLR